MAKGWKIEISSKLHVLTNVGGEKKRTLRVDASENRINIGESIGSYNGTLVNLHGDISSNNLSIRGTTGDISANDASFNDLSANNLFILPGIDGESNVRTLLNDISNNSSSSSNNKVSKSGDTMTGPLILTKRFKWCRC